MAFVREKKINGRYYHYLVENRREGGKHYQAIMAYLGRHPTVAAAVRALQAELREVEAREPDAEEKIDRLRARLTNLRMTARLYPGI
jgi:hypothetical protein